MKNKHGITLIALVVTIIVLLILAGVALSLVAGSEGIITKAQTAVDKTQTASAKEMAELTVITYVTDFYDEKYVQNNSTYSTPGSYVVNALKDGKDVGNYWIKTNTTDNTITVYKDRSEQYIEMTGTIETNGDVAWNESIQNAISVANYGDYFDLGTNWIDKENVKLEGNETIKADWRIFYKDDNGVWLILSDYLPINGNETNAFIRGTGTNDVDLDTYTGAELTDHPYSVYPKTQNRNSAITGLTKRDAWKNYLLPNNLKSNSSIQVVGALDVETWLKSWNSKGYTHLATSLGEEMEDGYKGYYVGEGNAGDNISATGAIIQGNEYNDTLYLTHKEFINNCYGYWLASPAASDVNDILFVGENNPNERPEKVHGLYVGRGDCFEGRRGVRPAVYLPNSITIGKNNGVWSIVE